MALPTGLGVHLRRDVAPVDDDELVPHDAVATLSS
jgi:hypothetical protein